MVTSSVLKSSFATIHTRTSSYFLARFLQRGNTGSWKRLLLILDVS